MWKSQLLFAIMQFKFSRLDGNEEFHREKNNPKSCLDAPISSAFFLNDFLGDPMKVREMT